MSLVVMPGENDTEEELLLRYDRQEKQFTRQAEEAEREASNLLENPTEEEAALQREIDQAEAEYQAALTSLIAEEDRANQAMHNLEIAPDEEFLTPEEQETRRQAEAEIAAFNASQVNRSARIAKALELQNLGLIPAAATDQEAILFLEAIEEEKTGSAGIEQRLIDDARFYAAKGVSLPEVNSRVAKHRALQEAHNAFQLKYRRQILNARYSKKIPDAPINPVYPKTDYRKVGDHYAAFGTRNNILARNIKIWKLIYSVVAPDDNENDWVQYNYNAETKSWSEVGSGFTPASTPAPPNTDTTTIFKKSGEFPSNLPWIKSKFGFVAGERDPTFGLKVYLESAGTNPLDQGYTHTPGIFNKKRAFKKCEKGYWLYEGIPEESTQCVYMGSSVVDSRFSYYPESMPLKYAWEPGTDDSIVAESEVAKQERQCMNDAEIYGGSYEGCFTYQR